WLFRFLAPLRRTPVRPRRRPSRARPPRSNAPSRRMPRACTVRRARSSAASASATLPRLRRPSSAASPDLSATVWVRRVGCHGPLFWRCPTLSLLQERLHAFARQLVGALVLRVPGMPAHPMPFHLVALLGGVEPLP